MSQEKIELQITDRLKRLRATHTESENQEISTYITQITDQARLGNTVRVNEIWKEFEKKYPMITQTIMSGWRVISTPKNPRKRGSRFYP